MRRGLWLDLLCVAALVWAGLLHWPTGDVSLSVPGPDAPAWGTTRDALLDGPDAGEWARAMLAFHDGRYNELSTQRLPGWIVIVNAVMFIEENVVRAELRRPPPQRGTWALHLRPGATLGSALGTGLGGQRPSP